MRIVVKVGTSTLAHTGGRLNIRRTEQLVKVLSDLKNSGHELVLVSSGAIGLGAGKLQIPRPHDMPTKQAAAAVGQCELMYVYDRLFAEYKQLHDLFGRGGSAAMKRLKALKKEVSA